MARTDWQVSTAEAYTVRCPACKSAPNFTCTYLPELISPLRPDLGWKPKSGQPTKRPHAERYNEFRRQQREKDRRRRDAIRLEEAKRVQQAWRYSIARSIRDGALRDQAELKMWLESYAHLLTDLETE